MGPSASGSPLVSVLALGFSGQLGQTLLLRELLVVFHGTELSIGIALASWLFWVGVGSFCGARVASWTRRPLFWAFVMGVMMLAGLPATILAMRFIRVWFGVVPGEALSFADIMRVGVPGMAPVCMLWGAQFVFLARLWREHPAVFGLRGAVHTYVCEAVGNLMGGALFSLLLVHLLNPMVCAALAGLVLMQAMARLVTGQYRARFCLRLLTLALFASLPVFHRLDVWSHGRQWQLAEPAHSLSLVETRPSRYGRIDVIRRNGQVAFFQSGQLVFSTASGETRDYAFEEQEAAALAHLALVQHPSPRDVLLIGGGMRGVLREMLAHPLDSIDYVEHDPALIELARAYVPFSTRQALRDPRVQSLMTDGRLHIKTTRSRYDLVLVDVPDPVTAALNRFYTREFFDEVRRRLRPGGVLVIGVSSTAGLRETSAANRNATLYHTLGQIFPRVLALGDRFLMLVATDRPARISADPEVLRRRFHERKVTGTGFSDRQFSTLLQAPTVNRINWILRHHGRCAEAAHRGPASPPLFPPALDEQQHLARDLPPVEARFFVNSDFRPIGYFHSLAFWSRHMRGRSAAWLDAGLRVRAWWALPLAGIVWLPGLLSGTLWRRLPLAGVRSALAMTVWTTGFATMATQVALLFAFQSQYGFVYEMIGLILALFMGGLALGAAACRATLRSFRKLACLQFWIAGWAVVLALGLPAAAGLASSSAILLLFGTMTFLSGLWNGINFPLALTCSAGIDARTDQRVGAVYGIELLGACLGALLAGVVIIPVLGIVSCFLLTAGLNVAAGLGIMMAGCKVNG